MRKPPGIYLEPEQRKAHEKLERLLRRRLREQRHTIEVGGIPGFGGGCEYEASGEGVIRIIWDPLQWDLLSLVLHEMLHPTKDDTLEPLLGGLSESAIEGMGTIHVQYVRETHARRAWWSREIRRRVVGESFRRWLKGAV